jgi:hypothetical protein
VSGPRVEPVLDELGVDQGVAFDRVVGYRARCCSWAGTQRESLVDVELDLANHLASAHGVTAPLAVNVPALGARVERAA